MIGMNNADYQLFTAIAQMKQNSLQKSLKNYLKKHYSQDKIISTKDYLLCEGTVPIMLVAHMDTVFTHFPQQIFYDRKQCVLWSPQGLGADDRAGVFAIMKIIQSGYRPHICFTTDEEMGGLGARALIKSIPSAPFEIKYIVELDRQGLSDCVFYECDNEDFQNFVEGYGFLTEWGSFSDISYICPQWKIAGVNLSVGYFNEHQKIETLYTNALYTTINKVKKMIDDINTSPSFEYIPSSYEHYWSKMSKYWGWESSDEDEYLYDYNKYPTYSTGPYKCSKCGRGFTEDDVFLVKTKTGEKKYYCVDCVSSNVNWCENCGEPFEIERSNEIYCSDCAKARKMKTNKES